MTDYDEFEDQRIKHLEMIQAVITRLGNDAFLIKGWSITVGGAFFGFAINSKNWRLAVVSIAPTLMFWALDTYFLRSERLFRCLYDRVCQKNGGVSPFFMAATSKEFIASLPPDSAPGATWWRVFWRPTISILYSVLVVVAIGVAGLAGSLHSTTRTKAACVTSQTRPCGSLQEHPLPTRG